MNVIAQCAGGLCNRINNLVNGIYLSELLGRSLRVWWDPDNACHCRMESLFSNEFSHDRSDVRPEDSVHYSPFHSDKKKANEKNSIGEERLRMTPGQKNYQDAHRRPDSMVGPDAEAIVSELRSIKSPTLIFSSSIILADIIPEREVARILSGLEPVPDLRSRIAELVEKHSIDKSVVGVHLRRTDYNLLDDGHVAKRIDAYLRIDGKKRFLVCSDSMEAERKFMAMYPGNVFCVDGKHYLERISKRRSDGHFSNLMRTEDSVRSALVDMHLLARTSFNVFSPISTFAQTIYRMSKTIKK